jgi:hypothetical protein
MMGKKVTTHDNGADSARFSRRSLFGSFLRRGAAASARAVQSEIEAVPDPVEVAQALRKQQPQDVQNFLQKLASGQRTSSGSEIVKGKS